MTFPTTCLNRRLCLALAICIGHAYNARRLNASQISSVHLTGWERQDNYSVSTSMTTKQTWLALTSGSRKHGIAPAEGQQVSFSEISRTCF